MGLYRASKTDLGQCEGRGYSTEVIYTSSDRDSRGRDDTEGVDRRGVPVGDKVRESSAVGELIENLF